jgi:monoamine oxidase
LAVEEGAERWVESLTALRPDLQLDPGGSLVSTWDDDPWVRAAYSTGVQDAATAVLARRWGALSFAGEHTAGEFHGLMEGALRSGRRAASTLSRMDAS